MDFGVPYNLDVKKNRKKTVEAIKSMVAPNCWYVLALCRLVSSFISLENDEFSLANSPSSGELFSVKCSASQLYITALHHIHHGTGKISRVTPSNCWSVLALCPARVLSYQPGKHGILIG